MQSFAPSLAPRCKPTLPQLMGGASGIGPGLGFGLGWCSIPQASSTESEGVQLRVRVGAGGGGSGGKVKGWAQGIVKG